MEVSEIKIKYQLLTSLFSPLNIKAAKFTDPTFLSFTFNNETLRLHVNCMVLTIF